MRGLPEPPLGNSEKIKFETPFRKIQKTSGLKCPEAVGQKLKNAPPFPLPAVLLCLSHSPVCVARGVRWCVGRCVCAVVMMWWSCLVMVVCVWWCGAAVCMPWQGYLNTLNYFA